VKVENTCDDCMLEGQRLPCRSKEQRPRTDRMLVKGWKSLQDCSKIVRNAEVNWNIQSSLCAWLDVSFENKICLITIILG
jgi:hypothetical protein